MHFEQLPLPDEVEEVEKPQAPPGVILKAGEVVKKAGALWKVCEKWASVEGSTVKEKVHVFLSREGAKARMIQILVDTGRIERAEVEAYEDDEKWEKDMKGEDGEICFVESASSGKA